MAVEISDVGEEELTQKYLNRSYGMTSEMVVDIFQRS